MKTVANYWTVDEAYIAASVLEGNGLSPNVRDVHAASMYVPQIIGGVSVEVPDAEYEKALEVLELTVRAKETLACPYCGSEKLTFVQLNWRALIMSLLVLSPMPKRPEKARCEKCRQVFQMPNS